MTPDDRDRLVRIETKIDALLDTQGDHEKRLRAVEKFKHQVLGVVALVGGAAGLATDYITKRLS